MAVRKASDQVRALRRKCIGRMVVLLAAFLVAFALAAVLFELFLNDPLANWVADATSSWIVVDGDALDSFMQQYGVDGSPDGFVQQNGGAGNWQIVPMGDGTYEVRDLSVYSMVKAAKVPFAVVLLAAGVVAIVSATLMHSLRYFDELSQAVTALLEDPSKPVRLSADLAITQNELNAVREAARANEEAAIAAERRKNELVAYLAHDIRTPLTSVIGYLSLLDEAPDLPEAARRRYIATADEKAQRLEGLIDEFFEITRYNLQSIPIERAWVEVRLFCEQVADSFYPDAQSRGLAVEVQAPEGVQFFVDADKLARACGNVMRNAVAYADEGTRVVMEAVFEPGEPACGPTPYDVTYGHAAGGALLDAEGKAGAFELSTSLSGGERGHAPEPAPASSAPGGDGEAPLRPTGGTWTLHIIDTGREISPAHLQSIFDKFYREDGARGTGAGGAGLGLAIAKEIVAAHGGAIGAESSRGVTTFTISLPA